MHNSRVNNPCKGIPVWKIVFPRKPIRYAMPCLSSSANISGSFVISRFLYSASESLASIKGTTHDLRAYIRLRRRRFSEAKRARDRLSPASRALRVSRETHCLVFSRQGEVVAQRTHEERREAEMISRAYRDSDLSMTKQPHVPLLDNVSHRPLNLWNVMLF